VFEAMVIDEALIADWTDRTAGGDVAAVQAAFRMHGAHGPEIIWDPPVEQLGDSPLRRLLAYWSTLATPERLPAANRIDPVEMRTALGYVALLDVIEDGRDFRYRLFGTTLAAVSEFDMTGRMLSEHPASPYIVEFLLAAYRAALRRQAPLFTEHAPAGTVVVTAWQRLILPLVDEAGQVVRFLSGNLPVAPQGRTISARL
jgi:hypothetical protein